MSQYNRRYQPMQPIQWDGHGVIRFKENNLVSAVLDAASAGRKCDLNDLACMNFRREDREQFAQLIGYSVSGAGELNYMRRSLIAKADAIAAALWDQQQRRRKRAARNRSAKAGSR